MPWKKASEQEQRYDLVKEMRLEKVSVTELCRELKISRKTAYKWKRRFGEERLQGLKDRSHRPVHLTGRTSSLWLRRLRQMRRRRSTWGTRKLHHALGEQYGLRGLPAVATFSRWLKRWGLAKGKRWIRRGPEVLCSALKPARHCNDVWTVDFKGWYLTGDGTRVDPLTVRDLYSRYGLRIAHLPDLSIGPARREFISIFKQYGLPKRIRSDNGVPFGGGGPTGLTRLSAWWMKLGIKVEFIAPGRPCENGAHEQFHRIYKAEVAQKPAWKGAGQKRRGQRWLRHYNEERPHEGLGMKVPASLYRKSNRPMPEKIEPWHYPTGWTRRWVKGNGEINWRGKRRYVGEAFVGDYVGLKPQRKDVWRVFFGPLLVGELHEQEIGKIRTAKYTHRK
jgi:putative transposase